MSEPGETTDDDAQPEIDEVIEANATGPASASVDGQSATQHTLRDQIAAAKYLRKLKAEQAAGGSTNRGRRIGFTRTIPPGTA